MAEDARKAHPTEVSVDDFLPRSPVSVVVPRPERHWP
jgi:hypothetical protein